MKQKKVKISKRQIKEDKFTTNMLLARDWLMDHWQPVALAAAAVIIIIVGISYFSQSQASRSVEGSARLSNAVNEMRRGNYQSAIVELNDIIDNYGGKTAATATFHLANAYYSSKNYDEAIAQFEQYLDEYGNSELKAASAIAGIAASYENKQSFDTAATKFMEAYNFDPESPNAPDYLLGAVRNYVNLGSAEQADEIIALLEQDYQETDEYRQAVMLSMKLET